MKDVVSNSSKCLPPGLRIIIRYSMKLDVLKQFAKLKQTLVDERDMLERRLAEIDATLASGEVNDTNRRLIRRSGLRRRRPNPMSLKEAIIKVTSVRPLSKEEILEAVKKLGYKFSTDRPMQSLQACLYQKKHFRRDDGRFLPVRGNSRSRSS